MSGDVEAVGVANVLVVHEEMADDLAYRITKALFDYQNELAAIHPEAEKLSVESAVAGSTVPFHAGAVRYYEEQGAWPGS